MQKILISTHHDETDTFTFGPYVRADYHTYGPFVELGAVPLILPGGRLSLEQIKAFVSMVDRIVIMGGHDVDPLLYGEDVLFENVERYRDRDANEILLIQEAIRQQKPLFGICRGLQIINVALGGSLYQNIHRQLDGSMLHLQKKSDYRKLSHRIAIEDGSFLAHCIDTSSIWVNSFHNQAVKNLGKGLSVSARSDVIEAIEHDTYPIIAVQRHPERSWFFDDYSKSLFNYFLAL